MKNILLSLLVYCLHLSGNAQLNITMRDFLGYELGTQFTRHHQVSRLCKSRCCSTQILHKLRPTEKPMRTEHYNWFYLSAPENLAQLETMRKDHLRSIGYAEGAKETTKDSVSFG